MTKGSFRARIGAALAGENSAAEYRERITMRKLRMAGFALIVAAGAADTARAESEGVCNDYAANAVSAQKANLERSGCRKTGDMWSLNWSGHYDWCRRNSPQTVAAERQKRMDELTRCTMEGKTRPPDPNIERCNRYADDVMAAIRKVGGRCSGGVMSGARWDPDRDAHFRWCMDARPEHVSREQGLRNHDADKCVRCFDYQNQAGAQAEENRNRGCGFTGPQWTEDKNAHFQWCWNLQTSHRGEPARHTRERAAALKNCPTAVKKKFCDTYADRAISQYHERRKLAQPCGEPKGAMWHANYQNHYGWCVAVSDAERAQHELARWQAILSCIGSTTRQSPAPTGEQCLFSAVVTNKKCAGVDGSIVTIMSPGSMSAMGCGESAEKAKERATAIFETGACVSEEDDPPAPGCCAISVSASSGCLCQGSSTLMRRSVPPSPGLLESSPYDTIRRPSGVGRPTPTAPPPGRGAPTLR